MTEHLFSNDGTGKCSVCGSEASRPMDVTMNDGSVSHYVVATHPLIVREKFRP